jgi:chromosomal replication initiation ATPase DnaA
MKSEIFNQYADRISGLFGVSKTELFAKSKKRELVDARHLLYYLCYKRPMPIVLIMKYMAENGYKIQHSSIIHGIDKVEEKIKNDRDYVSIVREAEKSVFI